MVLGHPFQSIGLKSLQMKNQGGTKPQCGGDLSIAGAATKQPLNIGLGNAARFIFLSSIVSKLRFFVIKEGLYGHRVQSNMY